MPPILYLKDNQVILIEKNMMHLVGKYIMNDSTECKIIFNIIRFKVGHKQTSSSLIDSYIRLHKAAKKIRKICLLYCTFIYLPFQEKRIVLFDFVFSPHPSLSKYRYRTASAK